MPLKGDLSAIGLAEIFQMLALGQKEGTLVVRSKHKTKRIFFSPNGVSLLTRAAGGRFRIGEALVKRGVITPEQLAAVLEEQKQSGRRLGELLVQKGWAQQQDIDAFVRSKLEDEIYSLFLWRDATFEFEEGPMPEKVDTLVRPTLHLTFDVNALLLEALRRTDEWARINEKVGGLHCVYAFVDEAARQAARAGAGEADPEIAAAFDGTWSLQDIQGVLDRSSFDVCKTAMELLTAGQIRELPADEVLARGRQAEEAGDAATAVRLYRALVNAPSEEGVDVQIVRRCAELCQKTGATEEALQWYKRLADAFRQAERPQDLMGALDSIVALNPDAVEPGLELFELCASGKDPARAEQLGQQLMTLSRARGEPETARRVAAKLAAMDPRSLPKRMVLVRVLAQLDAQGELREELRFLAKQLQPREPEHAAMLAELKALVPEFFREEYLPPEATARKPRGRGRVIGAASVLVGAAALATVLIFKFVIKPAEPPVAPPPDGKTQVPAVPPLDRAKFKKLLEQVDAALAEGRPQDAWTTLTEARGLAAASQAKDALAECEKKVPVLAAEGAARRLLDEADALRKAGKIPEAAAKVKEAITTYAGRRAVAGATVPVQIVAVPEGVRVLDAGTPKATPVVLELKPEACTLTFELEGYEPYRYDAGLDQIFAGRIEVRLNERRANWRRELRAPVEGELIYAHDALHVSVGNRVLSYGLEGEGEPQTIQVPYSIGHGPVVIGRALLYADRSHEVRGWDISDPTRRALLKEWKPFKTEEPVVGPLVADGGVVLIPVHSHVVSLDVESGERVRITESDREHPIVGAPVPVGETLLVIRGDGKLHGYDRTKASRRWEPVALEVGSPAVLVGLGSRAVAVGADGRIVGVEPLTGEAAWKGPALGPRAGPPRAWGGTLYVPLKDQTVAAIDWGQAEPGLRLRVGAPIAGAPAVTEQRIFVAGTDGVVRVFDRAKPDEPLWTFNAQGEIRRSPLVAASFLFVASGDRIFGVLIQ
jgi:tetratricopeptide (TPR) repeat protein/outer membrane protein assembly factor BamB